LQRAPPGVQEFEKFDAYNAARISVGGVERAKDE
jgi:hypothetical protein